MKDLARNWRKVFSLLTFGVIVGAALAWNIHMVWVVIVIFLGIIAYHITRLTTRN